LASDDYASSYARNVKAEYVPEKCSEVDFINGRRAFLLDMGLRKQIFFTKHLAFLFEEKARVNMHEELRRLGDQSKETQN
jgi:predicted metal-dependent HD superfamily phosphohydrolase